MDPYQRKYQITIPSSEPVRKKGIRMLDATRRRRPKFHGQAFSKQAFFNCLIAGMYELEANRDLDMKEVEAKGLLAVVVDRGAAEISRMIAAEEESFLPQGVRASIGVRDEEEDEGGEAVKIEKAPPPKAEHRKPRGLTLPHGFVALPRVRRDDRAQEEHQAPGRRPVP
jgi:hypothetical protein